MVGNNYGEFFMCILWHDWRNWEQYEVNLPARQVTKKWGLSAAKETRQKRTCIDCGTMQDKYVKHELL